MLLPLVDGNAEQATLQSVTVVVPPEQDSDEEDVLVVLELLEVLEVLEVPEVLEAWVELVDLLLVGSLLLSGLPSSSATGGLVQSLNKGMQGISKLGRLGSSQTTAVLLGRPQITTGPPHPGHQITGTIVEEVALPLLVVSQELAESPLLVINSVEKLSGAVVIVDVATEVPDVDVADRMLVEAHWLWLVDWEPVHASDDVLLAIVEVDCGEADVPVVLVVLFELVDAYVQDVMEDVTEVDVRVDDFDVELSRLDVDDRLMLLMDDHEAELGVVLDQAEEDCGTRVELDEVVRIDEPLFDWLSPRAMIDLVLNSSSSNVNSARPTFAKTAWKMAQDANSLESFMILIVME